MAAMAGKYWLAADGTSVFPHVGIAALRINLCNAWVTSPRFQAQLSVGASAVFLLTLAFTWSYSAVGRDRRSSTQLRQLGDKKDLSKITQVTNFVRSLGIWTAVVLNVANTAAAAWEYFSVRGGSVECIFLFAAQSLTWLAFALICALEARHTRMVSSTLARGVARAWWVVALVFAGAQLATLLIRRLECCPDSTTGVFEGFAAITTAGVNLAAAVALVVTVVLCESRVGKDESVDAEEPLLRDVEPHREVKPSRGEIPGYAGSSWVSRLTWQWMNPLLQRGYDARLEVDDVPNLAEKDEAQNLYKLYAENWERIAEGSANRMRTTVWRSFRRQFLQTGGLALVRACVMYVGPALITTFVDYKAEEEGKRHGILWRGIMLVFVLAASKSVDVLASHQFSFQCTTLGMAIRSTLITVVYRKGIRLTNAARGVHGVGQIVNYMSVDVQVMSDVIQQVHNLWLLPIQVVTALAILYTVVGWSMMAGLLTMVGIVGVATWSSKMQKIFQGHIMKAKDARIKATSVALNAMKVIKLQAWETHFQARIEELRDQEYHWIQQFLFQVAKSTVFVWCAPNIVSVVTFACCVIVARSELTPGQVFTAVATFRILQEPIRNFPNMMIAVSQAQVSLDRLEKYLRSEELDTNAVDRTVPIAGDESLAVAVQSASFLWTTDHPDETSDSDHVPATLFLRDINLEVKKGALLAVVGTVGSGKSSLLACILGEMPKLQGKVCVAGRTAYVPQAAWILSGTIEENILFGKEMDRRRYEETMRICALERDMEIFEHGDQTEIGERGLNLSGGQKQRIQLARAVYQDCDVYLLDDIFSAVDAHTGSAIFKDCVNGVLKEKTVILVTHQIDFLHEADRILVMRDGMIVQSGKYDDLVKPGTELETLVIAHHESMQLVEKPVDGGEGPRLDAPVASLERFSSLKEAANAPSRPNGRDGASAKHGSAKLVEEEQREIGRVSTAMYWLYLTKAFGPWLIIASLIVQMAWQTMTVLSDYWLAYETSDGQKGSLDPIRFIRVYALLSFGTWICVFVRTILNISLGVKTTQVFYLQMLRSIFRAPMAFFDTTPSGRILSRSSADQSTLDIWLVFYFGAASATYFSLFGAIVVMCQTAWPIIIIIIPLAGVYFLYQAYYVATSRELTRMDSITKAPIIHHFSESIAGFMVIRCFKKEDEFAQANVDRVNQNVRMVFHNNAASEWLGYRLEMIGTIVLCSLAFLLVVLPARLAPPQLVGLALSYGLSLNVLLYWTVWFACALENKMVSVERIHQFTKIPSEAPLVIPDRRPAADWPSTGTIEINNLQLRYRPGTPVVLKGITLEISGGEKVGIVGRTGSGKSTLIQALFRLVEASAGQIVIDGVDIATLGLSDLRSKFGIIPQEPTLFEGTVRANIDPLGQYSDNEIWECLRACQLEDVIRGKPEKLDSPVADDGDNWSVGQKQLFCLGRALLKRAKILVLDEATASVDAHTDWLIQKTIQEAFADSTVVSIAHRIPTVMNSNKVLVLDAGRVKEYDSPSRLLDGSNPSLFAALVKEYSTRGHVDM